MNRKGLLILGMIVWVSTLTHACYRDLKKEYDSYSPPAYFKDQFRPVPERAKPSVDEDFAAEKKRIEEAKYRWAKSLTDLGDKDVFLRPDPQLLTSLQQAATIAGEAANALKGTYSLRVLESLALLRNPGVKAAENRFRSAIEAFSQVSTLDEILRQYTAFTEGLMTGVGPMKGKDPIKMKFPFPGVLSLKGQIVDQEVGAQRENLEIARRDVVTAIRKTYWNLVFVLKARQITSETVELLEYLEAVANTRYQAGRTSYQDVIKVRIKRETLAEDLVTLKEKQRNLESKIREILNLSPRVELGSPKIARPPAKIPALADLYEIAQQRRQELLRLRAKVGKMERMIELAETMVLPPYTLNLSLYEDEAVTMVGSAAKKDSFPVSTRASRGAGLPKMPWYGTQDAYLRQTRQKLNALREELKKAQVTTHTMVRNAWFELDLARREISLYRDKVVRLSQSALDVSTRGYESGTVSFADVIGSYTIWLKASLTLDRKRSDYGFAWAELEQVVGTSLR